MTGSQVSLGKGFGNLMWYLTEKDSERVEFIEVKNLNSEKSHIIAKQMKITANESSRCQKPLYHTSLNWHPDDNPTQEQMKDVVDGYLKHLGLEDYQSVAVAHNDKDHAHVHIAVNRVHPDKYKAWELDTYIGKGRNRKVDKLHNQRVQEYLRTIEREYGWTFVPGKYLRGMEKLEFEGISPSPTRSEFHRNEKKKEQLNVFGVNSEEFDTRDPRLRAMDLKDQLFECESFQEVDEILDEKGLWIESKGQGAVFTDGVHSVKASDINRHLSGPKMEERFGENLNKYIEGRDQAIDAELGYRQLVDWSRDLKLEELENVSYIVEQQKDKKIRRLRHFQYLEKQYESILESLPEEFQKGFHDGLKVYHRFGKYLKEYDGKEDLAIADLIANPEQFGSVKDQARIVSINEKFQEAISLREQMKKHVHDLPGKSISEKKKHLELNSSKAKKKLKDVNKRIVKQLKSEHDYDDLYDPQAEQAKGVVRGGMYKALSLHRALNKIFINSQSEKNMELSKLMGNIGLLMSNPSRGSAKILKQAIKITGQKILNDGRGLGKRR